MVFNGKCLLRASCICLIACFISCSGINVGHIWPYNKSPIEVTHLHVSTNIQG